MDFFLYKKGVFDGLFSLPCDPVDAHLTRGRPLYEMKPIMFRSASLSRHTLPTNPTLYAPSKQKLSITPQQMTEEE
jgi:hypothetical protein